MMQAAAMLGQKAEMKALTWWISSHGRSTGQIHEVRRDTAHDIVDQKIRRPRQEQAIRLIHRKLVPLAVAIPHLPIGIRQLLEALLK